MTTVTRLSRIAGPAVARTRRAVAAPAAARQVWARRLHEVAGVLGRPSSYDRAAVPSLKDLQGELARVVRLDDQSEVWLALAAVSGQLPVDSTVTEVRRRAEFDGPVSLLDAIAAGSTTDTLRREVRIVVGAVVVDVHHTAHTDLATGIQRVARETVRRWRSEHELQMVAWIDHFHAFRTLSARETERMDGVAATVRGDEERLTEAEDRERSEATIIVPWRCTYVLPELVADRERNKRILALARKAQCRTGAIGFDCIPVTSGDTSADRVPDYFADHLATVRHFDRITTISGAAGEEYGGWRTMLAAIGMKGPDIRPILLPSETPEPDGETLQEARRRFLVAGMPMVLCVGTHEPRKNHDAVLHAAEILWQEGLRFSLTFVGGHSWRSDDFRRRLADLQHAGRAVESATGVSDPLLWAAYRVARCTIFPSFNEGYGLPAAESLAAGTPVIMSDYGSMREIAAGGGAVLVDPRDDHSVVAALRDLLVDTARLEELRAAARGRPVRQWADYAADVWDYLVG